MSGEGIEPPSSTSLSSSSRTTHRTRHIKEPFPRVSLGHGATRVCVSLLYRAYPDTIGSQLFGEGHDLLRSNYVCCLSTLLSLYDLEGYFFCFIQGFISFALDSCVMYEYILTAIFRCDKSKTLCCVKPLDFSLHVLYFSLLLITSVSSKCVIQLICIIWLQDLVSIQAIRINSPAVSPRYLSWNKFV